MRRRRAVQRIVLLLFLFAAGLIVVTILSLIPALAARAQLLDARQTSSEARQALEDQDLELAHQHFASAESSFIRAQGHMRNPLLRIVGVIPFVGRNPDAVLAMADAGALVTRAGRISIEAFGTLSDGLADLAPRGGAIPLEPIRKLAVPLERAEHLVREADRIFREAPAAGLIDQVDEARADFGEKLAQAHSAITKGAAITRELPAFLGADGETRRYFFGAQNPAELRGTGGLMGAYSVVTVRDGRPRFSRFNPVQDLGDVPVDEVEPPDPSYAARYDQFGGGGFWLNINMTPDFPTAAVAIERLYEHRTGERLDGTIVADPAALAALIEITGPVRVPGGRVDAETVVPYLANEAYAVVTDGERRKRLLGDVSKRVFERFLSGRGRRDPERAARVLAGAAAAGHLKLHVVDPDVQEALEAAGVAGGMAADGDYLAVVGNNAAGNKVDFYADRAVRYDVRLGDEFDATATATIDLVNEAPDSGMPAYVIGPFRDVSEAGENVTYLSTYCAFTCFLEATRRDGKPSTTSADRELGRTVFPTMVRLDSGASGRIEYDWRIEDAWTGNGDAGRYTLTVHGQPTIRPTSFTFAVRVPEGARIVRTHPPMQVEGDRATWEGETGATLTFEVEFERSIPSHLWRSLVRFLKRPIFPQGSGG